MPYRTLVSIVWRTREQIDLFMLENFKSQKEREREKEQNRETLIAPIDRLFIDFSLPTQTVDKQWKWIKNGNDVVWTVVYIVYNIKLNIPYYYCLPSGLNETRRGSDNLLHFIRFLFLSLSLSLSPFPLLSLDLTFVLYKNDLTCLILLGSL